MAKDASMRAFKCPTCGAPLEPEIGTLTMKCSYCGGTVIIPESLRTPTKSTSSGPTLGEAFQFGLNGVDLNQIVGNAMHLPQAISLAKQGRLDEAANIYSQITGMNHEDAMKSINALAAGQAVSLTPGRQGANWSQMQSTSYAPTSVEIGSPYASVGTRVSTSTPSISPARGCGAILGILGAVIGVIVALGVGAFLLFGQGNNLGSLVPSGGFAKQTLSFGSEGIGAGLFEDPRSLGVDGNGNIVVADYQDGRVQTFDSNGKYISGFSLSSNGEKVYVQDLAVGRDGQIYIAHNQQIFIYDANGNQTGEIGDDQHDYNDIAFSPDGTLYALSNDETIVRFKPDGSIDLEIPDTFSTITGDSELEGHLAVDGLGNMYVVGAFRKVVLKYSPQGNFVNQFGGDAEGGGSQPGKFTSPGGIAVDGYGRVFISDFFDIQVFDSDGAYLKTISMNSGVPFGLALDDQNNLFVVTGNKHVVKYEVQKPEGQ